MKVVWKNYPLVEKDQYYNTRDRKRATIVAEGWCDKRLYMRSWFCIKAGRNNDLNILTFLPIIQNIVSGRLEFMREKSNFVVQEGVTRNNLYLLVDGIYPNWSISVETMH